MNEQLKLYYEWYLEVDTIVPFRTFLIWWVSGDPQFIMTQCGYTSLSLMNAHIDSYKNKEK